MKIKLIIFSMLCIPSIYSMQQGARILHLFPMRTIYTSSRICGLNSSKLTETFKKKPTIIDINELHKAKNFNAAIDRIQEQSKKERTMFLTCTLGIPLISATAFAYLYSCL